MQKRAKNLLFSSYQTILFGRTLVTHRRFTGTIFTFFERYPESQRKKHFLLLFVILCDFWGPWGWPSDSKINFTENSRNRPLKNTLKITFRQKIAKSQSVLTLPFVSTCIWCKNRGFEESFWGEGEIIYLKIAQIVVGKMFRRPRTTFFDTYSS